MWCVIASIILNSVLSHLPVAEVQAGGAKGNVNNFALLRSTQ
jgi:hypothetical protein